MNVRPLFYVTFALCAAVLVAAAPEHRLEAVKELPKGLSPEIAQELDPAGQRVAGPQGPVADIWFAKEIEVRPNFRPTLSVKYPFTEGKLIGALRIPEGRKHQDFRGQEMSPGVYTLRYGQQPQDGNHIGTSDLADFLLALPAGMDKSPKPIAIADQLHQQSAQAVGTTHPAIFSLLPPEKKDETPALIHNKARDYWILNVIADGKQEGEKVPVPLRLVVIGVSEH